MTRSWDGVHALVVGIGVAGYAAATGLLNVGARVTVLDDRDSDPNREKATIVEALGGVVRLGAGTTTGDPAALLAGVDLVVVTPGLPPTAALPVAARSAGIDVLGEVDLAWRLRGVVAGEDKAAAWIGLTGTNGKTTTVEMLASMLRAGGLRAEAVGNIGLPVTDAVLDPQPHDVLAVELSSHQLYWSGGLALRAAAVLNIEDDHLEWHGSAAAYATAKGKIYEGCQVACVYNPAYPVTEELVRAADVQEGCRAIGFTTGVPAAGMVGVVDGVIADRAFVENRATSAAELVRLDELPSTAPHNIANAVAELVAVFVVVLLEPAGADTEDEPAATDVVDGARHVGQQLRVAVAVAGDQRTDLHSRRGLRPRAEHGPAFEVLALRLAVERVEVVPVVDDVDAHVFQIGRAHV